MCASQSTYEIRMFFSLDLNTDNESLSMTNAGSEFQTDHQFDMKMLLLLTQICKSSFLHDLSNKSGRIAWLKLPEYRGYMHVGIGLHFYSDQARLYI